MKYIYNFKEGSKDLKDLLGGKGANLSEMTKMGLSIPFGFTITTEACASYYSNNCTISEDIKTSVVDYLKQIEDETGKVFGGVNPLLLSVRSGARVSMPGMMDTVLNLGLNNETVENLAKLTNNARFAYDSYRRFIQMFSNVVLGMEGKVLEEILHEYKKERSYTSDLELTTEDLKALAMNFKEVVEEHTNRKFPENPVEQLYLAIEAVFASWENDRAKVYRKLNTIPDDIYTAVTVQSMVFGNMGETSGTGVLFTRNPIDGTKEIYGEYLMNAQGEDVVAGIRTPKKLDTLKDTSVKVYEELCETVRNLELHYKDMQDVEFTIENEKLYILQTRSGKRTAKAMVKIAVDMVNEGLISRETALLRIDAKSIDQLLFPTFSDVAIKTAQKIAIGLGASPGSVTGEICLTPERAKEKTGKVILVRKETSPEDIEGMIAAKGIITSTGGSTSHASVVARGMGKPCIVGCKDIEVFEEEGYITLNGVRYEEGMTISMDGASGIIYDGTLETKDVEIFEEFKTVLAWSNELKQLDVKANADNAHDARVAIDLGAVGIGLCRTEHMFFEAVRIPIVRRMIIANNKEEKMKALNELYEYQLMDFIEIYRETQEASTIIRLLDPPLHEFLPRKEEEIKPVAESLGKSVHEIRQIIEVMEESNPMLGHRGSRLAITDPEIYNMQVRAILNAAIIVNKEKGINIVPEIKLPLIIGMKELKIIKKELVKVAEEVIAENGYVDYKIGIMVEVPRAALISNELAEESDFISYGTNDLTQMTMGFSRDDSGKFLNDYINKKLFDVSPFITIDKRGVGKLVEISASFAAMTKPNIKLGVCGEHGGDPASIEFFHSIGLQYVSCSPYRVPVAIIAAAQAAIKFNNEKEKTSLMSFSFI